MKRRSIPVILRAFCRYIKKRYLNVTWNINEQIKIIWGCPRGRGQTKDHAGWWEGGLGFGISTPRGLWTPPPLPPPRFRIFAHVSKHYAQESWDDPSTTTGIEPAVMDGLSLMSTSTWEVLVRNLFAIGSYYKLAWKYVLSTVPGFEPSLHQNVVAI